MIALCSCSVQKQVPPQVITQHDTTVRVTERRDSVFVRDSIFVMVKGDTVIQYREHWNYRDRLVHDTLWRHSTDTLWRERAVIEKEAIKWYDKASIHIGRIVLAALLLLALWKILSSRLKL